MAPDDGFPEAWRRSSQSGKTAQGVHREVCTGGPAPDSCRTVGSAQTILYGERAGLGQLQLPGDWLFADGTTGGLHRAGCRAGQRRGIVLPSTNARSNVPGSTTGSTSISVCGPAGAPSRANCRRSVIPYLFSTKATRLLWDAPFGAAKNVVLIFGRETGGLPDELHDRYRDRFLAMPILSPQVQSLNLSSSVAIAVSEVLRQRRASERGVSP
jgi:hypothetical protein